MIADCITVLKPPACVMDGWCSKETLLEAILTKDLEKCREMLETNCSWVINSTFLLGVLGQSPLHVAVKANSPDIVHLAVLEEVEFTKGGSEGHGTVRGGCATPTTKDCNSPRHALPIDIRAVPHGIVKLLFRRSGMAKWCEGAPSHVALEGSRCFTSASARAPVSTSDSRLRPGLEVGDSACTSGG